MHTTKNQQDGGTDDRVIRDGPAVEAVRRWIEAASIARGSPLWRPLKSNPRTGESMIGQKRLSGRALHQIIQKRAAQVIAANEPELSDDEARERAAAYSTHSLRHGALTMLGNNGASLTELMELSRHSEKSVAIVMGYVRKEAQGAEAMADAGL
jgi:integrase